MKLTIGIVLASILIIGLIDFSDATFLPWPPASCDPKPPVKPPKPVKPPVKPHPQPPVKPPVKPPPKPVKPPKPCNPPPVPPPCNPPPCGPGGVACPGCSGREELCQRMIKLLNDLDREIKKCVCGVKYL